MLRRFVFFSKSAALSPFRAATTSQVNSYHYDPEDIDIPRTTTKIDLEEIRRENEKWRRADEFTYPPQDQWKRRNEFNYSSNDSYRPSYPDESDSSPKNSF